MIQLPNNLINEILSYAPDHRDNYSLVMKELNHINTWCKLCYKIKYNNKKFFLKIKIIMKDVEVLILIILFQLENFVKDVITFITFFFIKI